MLFWDDEWQRTAEVSLDQTTAVHYDCGTNKHIETKRSDCTDVPY